MIVVTVELWSAITGQKKQLAKMHICNDGTGSNRIGNYEATTFRGRDEGALSRLVPQRTGKLIGYRRLDKHIWNLVAGVLANMGYKA